MSATVAALAPGHGTPGGVVTFSVGGHPVGSSPLVDGVAVLDYPVPAGARREVAVAYSGSASFLASSASLARTDPSIRATLSSATDRSRYGWYRSPVTVIFTCTAHGAPLAAVCPGSVTLAQNGAGQSVSRTISGVDGGTATANLSGIRIDRRSPRLVISGVRNKGSYFASAPPARCGATDALSGVASCTITHRTRGSHETFTATATDRAGNVSRRMITVTLLSFTIKDVPFSDGRWTVHVGHVYTLLAVAASRPTYVDAAVAPRRPAGLDGKFRSLGHGRWALGVTVQRALRSHQYWNLGIKVGHTIHVLRIHAVR